MRLTITLYRLSLQLPKNSKKTQKKPFYPSMLQSSSNRTAKQGHNLPDLKTLDAITLCLGLHPLQLVHQAILAIIVGASADPFLGRHGPSDLQHGIRQSRIPLELFTDFITECIFTQEHCLRDLAQCLERTELGPVRASRCAQCLPLYGCDAAQDLLEGVECCVVLLAAAHAGIATGVEGAPCGFAQVVKFVGLLPGVVASCLFTVASGGVNFIVLPPIIFFLVLLFVFVLFLFLLFIFICTLVLFIVVPDVLSALYLSVSDGIVAALSSVLGSVSNGLLCD